MSRWQCECNKEYIYCPRIHDGMSWYTTEVLSEKDLSENWSVSLKASYSSKLPRNAFNACIAAVKIRSGRFNCPFRITQRELSGLILLPADDCTFFIQSRYSSKYIYIYIYTICISTARRKLDWHSRVFHWKLPEAFKGSFWSVINFI